MRGEKQMARKKAADEIVTATELGARLGLTSTRVAKLAADGVMVKAGRGRYRAWASVKGYTEYLRRGASGRESPAAKARAALLTIEAKRAQLKLGAEMDKYIDRDEAERSMNTFVGVMRRSMMAIPGRVSSEMGLGRTAVVRMEDLTSAALREFVDNMESLCKAADKDWGQMSRTDDPPGRPAGVSATT
jgi:biotin operon repressor